jgi:hypothetical protein
MRTLLAALLLSLAFAGGAQADSWVSGHYTRGGRWVEGHWRDARPAAAHPSRRSSYDRADHDAGPRASSYRPAKRPRYPSSYRRKR